MNTLEKPTKVSVSLEAITRVSRDLRKTADRLSDDEARYIVDYYYDCQGDRIRAKAQQREHEKVGEPHELVSWIGDNNAVLERNLKSVLEAYVQTKTVGRWAMGICGIGPVITAGLIAHIDPQKCRTAGAVWKFAGLDPTVKWEKKQKRPWNAKLKKLCYLIGESFVKVSNNEDDFYGKIYKQAKFRYTEKNERGDYKEDAARILSEKNFGKDTEARKHLESGKLPPAQIHARAKRVAVKLFLSHFCHVVWEDMTGEKPPLPYVIAILGHKDNVNPPNWPMAIAKKSTKKVS